MAVTNWVGGDGTGTQQTDWTRAANWDNGVPGSDDDAVIGNVTYDPTIPDGTDPTLGSIQVTTGGQLTAGNNVITLDGVDGSGLAFYLNGTGAFIKGTSTITFTDSSNQYIAINTSNANRTFYNVTVNKSGSGDVYIYQSRDGSSNEPLVISNNLTVSARGFSTANDSSSPSTYFDLTVEGDCTVSGGTLEGNAASGATVRLKSLTVSSGTYSATGGETIITGETGAGRAVDIVGTFTHNSGTLSIQTQADTVLRWPSSSEAYHIRINDASCIARPTGDNKPLIAGNLTISAGEFNTLEGGQNHALTVEGTTTLGPDSGSADQATLTCNASAVSLGSTKTNGAGLHVRQGGTFTGGSGTHTIGSIVVDNNAAAKFTNTSGTATINGHSNDSTRSILIAANSVCVAAGTMDLTYGTASNIQCGNAAGINHLTLTGNVTYTQSNSLLMTGNLTITSGTTLTTSGSNYALTVTGDIHIDGTLTGNASTISGKSVHIDGTFTHDGALTCTGIASTNYAFQNLGTWTPGTSQTTTFSGDGAGTYHVKSNDWNNVILNAAGENYYLRPKTGTGITFVGYLTVTDGSLYQNANSDSWAVTGAVTINGGRIGLSTGSGDLTFGSLTIAGGATYYATSGITTLNGNFTMSSDTATFTHNSGTVEIANNCELLPTDFDSSETARHVFNNVTQSAGTFYLERPCKIEGNYTKSGGDLVHYAKCTMGTTSASSTLTVNSGEWKMYGYYGSPYLYAASELKPINITGSVTDPINWDNVDSVTRDTYIYIKGINYQKDTTTGGNGARIVLDGDCEFDAVTVSGGDTLDLNGQRAVIGGLLSVSTGTITATNSLIFLNAKSGGFSTRVFNVSTFSSAGSTIVVDHDSPLMQIQSDESFNNLMFRGSGNVTDNDVTATGTTWFAGENYDNSVKNQDYTLGGIVIPTGGVLSAGSGEFTCSGDFCIGGGLIGRSAYDFNGAASGGGFINCTANAVLEDIFDGGGTVEAWIRIDGDAGTASGMRPFSKDKWFVSVDNDASGDVYKLRLYQFFSGDNGVWSSTNTVLSKDKWHHIAITYNNGATTNDPIMYVDGKQVAITESSTPTGTFDADGSDELYLGNRENGERTFNGVIGMARLFDDIRTVGELRTDMFNAYADMSSTHLLKAMYQFDEGTSTALENVANAGTADGTITANSSAWVTMGDSNFVYDDSTLNLTGTGDFVLTNGSNFKVYNLTMAAATKTTTLIHMPGSSMNVYGTHTVGAGTYTTAGTPSVTYQGGGTVSDGGAGFVANYITYWSSTASVPAAKFRFFISDQAPTNLGGDMVCEGPSGNLGSAYFRGGGYTTNTNNYQVTTPKWVFDASTTMNIGSSTMILNSTDGLSTSSATSVLTAGPGCTISGTNAATTFKSQNDWNVVGNVENLNVTNEELKVTGMVTNCTGLIHQMNPTQDADQQLDKDTADDRDVQFASLNMDRNTELVG